MSKSTSATFGILFVAFIWGVEFVLVHNAIDVLEPHSFNAVRFGVASLFVGICLLIWRKSEAVNLRMVKHGFWLGVLLFLGFTFQTFSLLYTTVSNCGFITSLSVVLVPLLAYLLLGERPRILTIVGVSVAAAGLYSLTTAGDVAFNIGDFLAFVGAIMFALHMVYTGKYSRRHGALNLTLVQLLTVTAMSLSSVLIFEDWRMLLDYETMGNGSVLLAIFVASILGTGVAVMVQTRAQNYLSSTRVALIFSLEPVFAAVTAYLVLSEQLSLVEGIGAALILAGIILSELPTSGGRELQPVAVE